MKKKIIENIYTIMFFVGLVLVCFAIRDFWRANGLVENGIQTKAKVIKYVASKVETGYVYRPVFEYRNTLDENITFKSPVGSGTRKYKIGELVEVIYAKDGSINKELSFWGLYRWTIFFLIIASPMLVISIGYLLYSKKVKCF